MSEYSGPGFIRANGRPCVKSAEIDVELDTKNVDVEELIEGHAGHSVGAKKYQVTVTQSVPKTGYEVDWFAIGDTGLEITLDFVIPGVCDIKMKGDVRTVKNGTKVNQANTINFTFHGKRTDGV